MAALWDHQRDAVKAVVAEIGTGGRCQAIMACGTGKTVVGAEVSRQVAPGGRVLIVVPTLELLAQTARSCAEHLGAGAGLIAAVCSESAATMEAAEIRSEMEHLNAGVSTDPEQAARWARSPGRVTMLVTYQSLHIIAAMTGPGAPGWDLIVIDEAHRSAGRADRAWHVIHDDSKIPARRRLYMTATPRIMGRDQADVASMDDESVFGPAAFELTFADAISRGLLADYRVVVSVVTDADVRHLAARRETLSAGGPPVPADMLAAQVTILKAGAEWGLSRVITYHHRVNRAHRFASTLLNAADLVPAGEKPGHVRAWAVDGTMRLAERREALRHLTDPGQACVVVANARVLSEGVDVPELDGVMFADPRDSATDVVQAVGRALRRGAGEGKVATIVVPVLVADAGDAAELSLDDSAYAAVWRVVRALRAHDERAADWLDRMRASDTARHERAGGSPHGLPDWLIMRGIPVTARFAEAFRVKLLDMASTAWDAAWELGFAAAAAYKAEHSHLDPPQDHVMADGFRVGGWVSNQRIARKKNAMSARRARRLDELGMIWDSNEHQWQVSLAAAAAYSAEHGHLSTPKRLRYQGVELYQWLATQRKDYKAGKLTAARIAALEALGFPWSPFDADFADGLDTLAAFTSAHGHCRIPRGTRLANGAVMGIWLDNRRKEYRQGILSADRIAALETAGMVWDPHVQDWRDGLADCRDFREAHGHLEIPHGYRGTRIAALALWLSRRRRMHAGGSLPQDRVRALEELGIAWETPLDRAREAWLTLLAAYVRQRGHARVPVAYVTPDGKNLGQWLSRQRKDHRLGAMPPEREKALRDLGVTL